MRRRSLAVVLSLVLAVLLPGAPAAQADASRHRPPQRPRSNATFHNDARTPGADPFVYYERRSGYYYAYSTEGADAGWNFGIYRSPDLATWEHLPGGALRAGRDGNWAHDWFWAPEVYHNPRTGLYFLFYAGRMNTHVAENFRYADFEEPSKVSVAVATSPAGPFRDIAEAPLDYHPYDPKYHDVNLIMDAAQKKPPATRAAGETAPLGTYIPFIDPNVFFDDGKIYLYYSRNAYRNWVWDDRLGKYVEESNIYAVRLDTAWWNDPRGRTMPRIAPEYRDTNVSPQDPPGTRKDGFTPILSYAGQPQDWENAHVDDYAKTHGQKKDRRWEEGSTTIRSVDARGRPLYYLTYSANNFENEFYGVGFATARSPLGPWRKSAANPILAQDPAQQLYSTGHGSIVDSPDGTEHYYVHHARPSTTDGRALYTTRLRFADGDMSTSPSTSDQPLPSGVAPFAIHAQRHRDTVDVVVRSAAGAAFDLANPLNRLRATLSPRGAGTVTVHNGRITVRADRPALLTVTYQRQRADGGYYDVTNGTRPVRTSILIH